jgi:hypothetical protein
MMSSATRRATLRGLSKIRFRMSVSMFVQEDEGQAEYPTNEEN